jgi:hypothetical protein
MAWAPLPADAPLDEVNNGSSVRQPVPGRQYNVEDAVQELGMSPEEAQAFVATGKDPRAATTPTASSGFTPLPADAKLDPASPAQVVNASQDTLVRGDQMPHQPAYRLSPEDQAEVVRILSEDPPETAASHARQFVASKGFTGPGDNFDEVVAGRLKGAKINSNVTYALPKPDGSQPMTAGAAAVRGAGSMVGANTIDAALHTVKDYLSGDTSNPIDDFKRWEDINYGIQEADEANHPAARLVGQLVGGLAIPSDAMGEAVIAGKAVLRSGGSMVEARAAALAAARNRLAVEGAGVGTVSGFDNAAPGQGALGAVEGAATGAGAGYGLAAAGQAARPVIAKASEALSAAAPALAPEAVDAAQAANDLGITLPKFALSDADRASAGAVEQTQFGRGPITAGRNAMIDTSQAARDKIASDLGTPLDNTEMGDQARDAAVAGVKANRSRIGNIYDQARAVAQNTPVWAQQTAATLKSMIADQNQALNGTKVGTVLQGLLNGLKQKGGVLTIDGARLTRTELRSNLINDAGVTPDNATRLTNQVMDAINEDMSNGLKAAGREDAIPLYQQADRQWAQQIETEDDVLKPILGKNMDEWGENVARRINSDVKGNGTRLAQFLRALPQEQANNVRASIIQRLGTARDGAQNDVGDRFSLSTFLTNWNQIKAARNLIFAPETRVALEKLAKVADLGKLSEAERNHSNSAGGIARFLMRGGEVGGAGLLLTGQFKEAAVTALLTGLMALRQHGAAKLLADPDFAKKLVSSPANVKAAQAFWSRSWVQAMAAKNPAIASEIQLFQNAVNDNLRQLAAASPQPGKKDQNQ